MAGTKEGARKAALTNKLKHGPDFYANIGRRGGIVSGIPKGFALMPTDKVKAAGRKGGAISKRGPSKNKQEETYYD